MIEHAHPWGEEGSARQNQGDRDKQRTSHSDSLAPNAANEADSGGEGQASENASGTPADSGLVSRRMSWDGRYERVVVNSRLISLFQYDRTRKQLYVEFTQGKRRVYLDVEEAKFHHVLEAESIGRAFLGRIHSQHRQKHQWFWPFRKRKGD